MDKNTISLIGIVDTLKYLLETDKKAKKSKDAADACKRLERMRLKLLSEGLRQSQVLGAARDSVFEVAYQLGSHLSEENAARNIQWVVHGLLSVDIQDVQPPPLPSSSSGGPKSVSPEVVELADALTSVLALRSKTPHTPAETFLAASSRAIKPVATNASAGKNGKVK